MKDGDKKFRGGALGDATLEIRSEFETSNLLLKCVANLLLEGGSPSYSTPLLRRVVVGGVGEGGDECILEEGRAAWEDERGKMIWEDDGKGVVRRPSLVDSTADDADDDGAGRIGDERGVVEDGTNALLDVAVLLEVAVPGQNVPKGPKTFPWL